MSKNVSTVYNDESQAPTDMTMMNFKFRSKKKQYVSGVSMVWYLCLVLCTVLVMANCKTGEYKDGYEKGLKAGKKAGFVMGYEKARVEWYKIGERDGYQKGTNAAAGQVANEWYNKGVNEGYELGLKKGQSEGFKEGTRFFLKKWWKPSLGLVILFLVSVFIFFTILLLTRKKMKEWSGKTVQVLENFLVSKKMERVLKNNPGNQ